MERTERDRPRVHRDLPDRGADLRPQPRGRAGLPLADPAIVFFIAIAVVIYMFWRDRLRHEIDTWSERSRRVFYGSALLALVDFAAYLWPGRHTAGLDAFAFIAVLILCGYAMWRVWQAERTYGY